MQVEAVVTIVVVSSSKLKRQSSLNSRMFQAGRLPEQIVAVSLFVQSVDVETEPVAEAIVVAEVS